MDEDILKALGFKSPSKLQQWENAIKQYNQSNNLDSPYYIVNYNEISISFYEGVPENVKKEVLEIFQKTLL